jgi:O-acetyl-ADP-ribose deacetylase (regulator of RNase III)
LIVISIVRTDITTLAVDAIVNAANSSLLGGSGVDGAIHRAAGNDLEFACRMLNGCKTGDAKATAGFKLPSKYIFHTVGPVWRGGSHGEADALASCYRRCLQLAAEYNVETIAFPAISCGIYRFPISLAAEIATATVSQKVLRSKITHVTFAIIDETIFECYSNLLSG